MRIAVIAWGHAITRYKDLALETPFEPRGPWLPLEYSRISSDGTLAIVIDETAGIPCLTSAAPSAFADLDRALANVWEWSCEERGDRTLPVDLRGQDRVGFVVVGQPLGQSVRAYERHADTMRAIGRWARQNAFDAAIWTALDSNFREKTGHPFSAGAAVRYLATLGERDFKRALLEIHFAPSQVRTAGRRRIEAAYWRPVPGRPFP